MSVAVVLVGLMGCQSFSGNSGQASSKKSLESVSMSDRIPWPVSKRAQKEADLLVAKGSSLEKENDLDQAIASYQEAIKKDRRRTDAYRRLALLHDKQGRYEESAQYYERVLQQNPKDSQSLCDYGYSQYLRSNYKESEQLLRKSVKLDPRNARAHNNLAVLLTRTQRTDEAIVQFRAAGSDPVEANVNVAYALMWNNQLEQATEYLAKALEVDPNSAVANRCISVLETHPGGKRTPADPAANAPGIPSDAILTAGHEPIEESSVK